MSERTRARSIQRDTGMSYQTCLRIVRGEVCFEPSAPDCLVRTAVEYVRFRPNEGPTVQTPRVPCACMRCSPS